jgi:hypothetical protein
VNLYLVITRDGARIVKRRPRPEPGEWIVELRVTFPPPLAIPLVALDLPAELALDTIDADVLAPEVEPDAEEAL